MTQTYENLCQMLEKEIKNVEQQNGGITKESLELLKCLTETLSNIKLIMKAKEDNSNNMNSYNSYIPYPMMSGAQRRDSMGRYMDYNPYMMDMDSSYARGRSNNSYNSYEENSSRRSNSYSRDDSRKKMIRKLETLMDDTMSEKERMAIQDCIGKIDQG